MNAADRARFDRMLRRIVEDLPARWRSPLDTMAVVVEDVADRATLASVGMGPEEGMELCGLHSGVPDTDGLLLEDGPVLPSQIMLFREPIVDLAGGWVAGEEAVGEQIRVTLLHELGHQLGLDEDDLEALGYD